MVTWFQFVIPPSHCRRWWQYQQLSGWSPVHLLWCSAGTGTPLDLWKTWSSMGQEEAGDAAAWTCHSYYKLEKLQRNTLKAAFCYLLILDRPESHTLHSITVNELIHTQPSDSHRLSMLNNILDVKHFVNSHFHPCQRMTCCHPVCCTGSPADSSNPLKYPRWTSSDWRSEPGPQQSTTHRNQKHQKHTSME